LEQDILAVARRHGIRFIGPNGIGTEVDINPLVALEAGQGCRVLDTRLSLIQ
jgi:acyl-CoA synthetase (NDP forming)